MHLNWILIEQTHSPIRLSLWHLETGTPFLRPSSQQLITFNRSRPASTDALDSYPIPKSHLIFARQGSTADYRGCTFLVQLLLVSICYKKKKKKKKKIKIKDTLSLERFWKNWRIVFIIWPWVVKSRCSRVIHPKTLWPSLSKYRSVLWLYYTRVSLRKKYKSHRTEAIYDLEKGCQSRRVSRG